MFRGPNSTVARAKPQTGEMPEFQIPYKGLDLQAPLAAMDPMYGLSLINVISDSFGLRTRKGYTLWNTGLPAATPVNSIFAYWPSTVNNPTLTQLVNQGLAPISQLYQEARSFIGQFGGDIFSAQGGLIYNVTPSGSTAVVAEAGVGSSGAGDYWNGQMFANIAGSFYIMCNEDGGYSYYDGTTWATPTFGGGAGQISGGDPAYFTNLCVFKRRIWFIEKGSTRGWYLPVDSITGLATSFDFGPQFIMGGHLANLSNWTLDGGAGIDDQLCAFSQQGDVIIYVGTDPATPSTFSLRGVWNCGPLPTGSRQVLSTGGDIQILSQFGLLSISQLISATALPALAKKNKSFRIDPLLARLMRDYAGYNGWQIIDAPSHEMMLIGIPNEVGSALNRAYLVYKYSTEGWTIIQDAKYSAICNVAGILYAGNTAGQVVRAFDGPWDNTPTGGLTGTPIQCQVTTAYQNCGKPGHNKTAVMIRPGFLTSVTPSLSVTMLTNYGVAAPTLVPSLPPTTLGSQWNVALWNTGIWAGLKKPIHQWISVRGFGFAFSPQLDFLASGDTLLTDIDFWVTPGGVM